MFVISETHWVLDVVKEFLKDPTSAVKNKTQMKLHLIKSNSTSQHMNLNAHICKNVYKLNWRLLIFFCFFLHFLYFLFLFVCFLNCFHFLVISWCWFFFSPSAVCYRRISNRRTQLRPGSGEKIPAARWPPPSKISEDKRFHFIISLSLHSVFGRVTSQHKGEGERKRDQQYFMWIKLKAKQQKRIK